MLLSDHSTVNLMEGWVGLIQRVVDVSLLHERLDAGGADPNLEQKLPVINFEKV